LKGYGKDVTGDASEDDKNMTRAVSQFVGSTMNAKSGWDKIRYIRADSDKGAFGRATPSSCGGQAAIACQGKIGGVEMIWITGGRWNTFSGTSYAPSQLARILAHEVGHSVLGTLFDNEARHRQLDRDAKRHIKNYGLDGGGCSGSSAFGLGAYTGC
jgi:hypothetical protein